MASVDLLELQKSYGKQPVVRGLSLQIASGELVALLGPSGCGKTTTLRMIAGLERADGGRIVIGGEEVDGPGRHVPPEKRRLGMVFQSYAVWPHRSVFENVAYPLALRGEANAEVERKVKEALSWVRLEALSARRPHELSGGQLQRVALARALVASPRLLLLDEPLSNLDAALREELRAEIAALRARLGTTLIYVTHDQAEALALSDRVAVMNGGKLEQVGPPEALYHRPATPFVAGFVGGANLLEGAKSGRAFEAHGTRFELPDGADCPDGPCTLVVRPEDLHVDALGSGAGTKLTLSARLFLGHAMEYRFPLGDRPLRAVGAARDAKPGSELSVRVSKGTLFPR